MVQNTATAWYSYTDPYDTDQSSDTDTSSLGTTTSDITVSDSSDAFATFSTLSTAFSSAPLAAATPAGVGSAPPSGIYVTPSGISTTLYESLGSDIPTISPLDINQVYDGDCYLMSALGEMALVSPVSIENMIQDDGNGIYTVTFDGGFSKQVNINNVLAGQYGAVASVVGGVDETWPLVIEAAYAEWLGGDPNGTNLAADFAKINFGDPFETMEQLTGEMATSSGSSQISDSAAQLLALSAAGDMITFTSYTEGPYNLDGDHVYMYDGLTTVGGQTYVELLNPWGASYYEGYEPNLIPIADLSSVLPALDYNSGIPGEPITLSPTVNGIQLQASSASLSAGQTVTINLTWSDAITVAPGSVSLALSDGGVATYVSGSGTNTLQFSYTVASAESISSLSVWGINEAGEYGVNFYDLTDTASGQQASTYFTGLTQTDDVISNTLSLSGTNNNENVSGYTITMAADSGATISGGANSISVGDGSTLTLSGSGNTVNTGNSDTVTDNTGGNSVAVSGSNDLITASSDTITMSAGDTGTNVIGSSNTIDGTSGDVVTVTGAGNTINASSIVIGLNAGDTGTAIAGTGDTIYGTGGDGVTVTGANNVVNASGVTIALSAGDTGTNVIGSSNTIDGTSGDVVTVTGAGNTINASGIVIGLNAGDTGTTLDMPQTQLSLAGGDFLGQGVVDFADFQLVLSNFGQLGYDFADFQMVLSNFGESGPSLVQLMGGNAGTNITGSNDTIYGTGNDAMTVTGTNDTINASNVTIGLYADDTDTTVTGSSDMIFGTGGEALTVTGSSNFINTGINGSVSVAGNDDTVAFSNISGASTVSGFNSSDALQFNQTLFTNFAAAMNDATQVGANTVFAIDGSDSVTLVDVAKNTLTASNFHFV